MEFLVKKRRRQERIQPQATADQLSSSNLPALPSVPLAAIKAPENAFPRDVPYSDQARQLDRMGSSKRRLARTMNNVEQLRLEHAKRQMDIARAMLERSLLKQTLRFQKTLEGIEKEKPRRVYAGAYNQQTDTADCVLASQRCRHTVMRPSRTPVQFSADESAQLGRQLGVLK